MEDNPEFFPQATLTYVTNKIKEGAVRHPSVNDYAIHLMKQLNQSSDGTVELETLNSILKSNNVFLTDHELHTLDR